MVRKEFTDPKLGGCGAESLEHKRLIQRSGLNLGLLQLKQWTVPTYFSIVGAVVLAVCN